MSRSLRAVTRMALISLVLGAAAAGCAVGPDYTRPSIELVHHAVWHRGRQDSFQHRIRTVNGPNISPMPPQHSGRLDLNCSAHVPSHEFSTHLAAIFPAPVRHTA
jgi:hypothetical protein